MVLQIDQFMCREDNFGVLIHDPKSGETALIDAPEERPILAAIERTGWKPTMILTTHHHQDHVEANLALKERFGLKIFGPKDSKIPGIDVELSEGSKFEFAGQPVEIIGDARPHRRPHLLLPAEVACRLRGRHAVRHGLRQAPEKPAPVMFQSLKKLVALPAATTLYCGHEYTLATARFALTIDPTNSALKERAAKVEKLRADGKPTLPTTLAEELATNPFIRWHDPAIRKNLGMENATDAEVFAEIRKRKDNF